MTFWEKTPTPVLLHIFSYLPGPDIIRAGLVCPEWYKVAQDEFLWKEVFFCKWNIKGNTPLPADATSWKDEFRRLSYRVPTVESEVLEQHTDEVLYISFSHNGEYFATSSKDGTLKVWKTSYPISLKYNINVRDTEMKFPQFSKFNHDDSLLLAVGPQTNEFDGIIVVYNLETANQYLGVPQLVWFYPNSPFDMYGDFYEARHLGEQYVVTGELGWTLNNSSQVFIARVNRNDVFDFEELGWQQRRVVFCYSEGFASRYLMFADCHDDKDTGNEQNSHDASSNMAESHSHHSNRKPIIAQEVNFEDIHIHLHTGDKQLLAAGGSSSNLGHPVLNVGHSDPDLDHSHSGHGVDHGSTENDLLSKPSDLDSGRQSLLENQLCLKKDGASDIFQSYFEGERVENLAKDAESLEHCPSDNDMPYGSSWEGDGTVSPSSENSNKYDTDWGNYVPRSTKTFSNSENSKPESELNLSDSKPGLGPQDATQTLTGFEYNCESSDSDNSSDDSSLSVHELTESELEKMHWQRRASMKKDKKYLIFTAGTQGYVPHEIGIKKIDVGVETELYADGELVHFLEEDSSPDYMFQMKGQIIGLCLSPDHRYLYVNIRSWPPDYDPVALNDDTLIPPIAEEVDLHVIDLVKMKDIGVLYKGHRGFTPSEDCFYIFLDVCDKYVASGSEDKNAYVWDQYYKCLLAKLPHQNVVNCVAFNPADREMLVTVSDDFKVKVWRSRVKDREVKLGPWPRKESAV